MSDGRLEVINHKLTQTTEICTENRRNIGTSKSEKAALTVRSYTYKFISSKRYAKHLQSYHV